MKRLLLVLASSAFGAESAPRGCLRGQITVEGPVPALQAPSASGTSRIVVRAVRNSALDNIVQPLSKPELYRAVCSSACELAS